MALTEAEKQELLNAIKAESSDVTELETTTTLEGMSGLPGMQNGKLVLAPLDLLREPANAAAQKAERASSVALNAADIARTAADEANIAKQNADTSTSEANAAAAHATDAAQKAESAALEYESTAGAALTGATMRFAAFVEQGTIQAMGTSTPGGDIVYVKSAHNFAYRSGTTLFGSWLIEGLGNESYFIDINTFKPYTNKTYLFEDLIFVWNPTSQDLVEVSGSGSGSGFYNVTNEQPLSDGYYTKETAISALNNAKIKDDAKPGMIITFKDSLGKWRDYRFSGNEIKDFLSSSMWEEYGGSGTVKKITVRKGTTTTELTPNEAGNVELDIPDVVVDETIEETSTNPVAGKAVAAGFKNLSGKYGASIQLNTIGEGPDKAFSMSLIDENGNVLNTSDMFTGGGGGSVATTKIVLTRVTPNSTVKLGDTVKLTYNYNHIDTTTNESTGNAGKAVISITHGANTNTTESSIAAGSSNTIDVSKYMGVGTNTIKVRVSTGEGAEMQVAQITWTINVVQLTLSSSFNIATAIERGDIISVPYALSGSGNKTLRCFVDGVDKDDRSITASTANGSFSISTRDMLHGPHTIQMVVELELSGGLKIKSNSIYLGIGVREQGNRNPLICTRFEYSDGTIIPSRGTPYIETRQYDAYSLHYAVYNPKETPTRVLVSANNQIISEAMIPFTVQKLTVRAMEPGQQICRISCEGTQFFYELHVNESELNVKEPKDNLQLRLTAQGRSNNDANKDEWSYEGVRTEFKGFKWGGDGWMNGALRINDKASATIMYQPLKQPDQDVTNAFAFLIKFKVSEVMDDNAEVIRCIDKDGTGFVITSQEARFQTKGKASLAMKMAAGEIYEVAFVSFPKAYEGSSDYEKKNTEMVYLYINGIMSGSVQRSTSDSVYQSTPQNITMGAIGATLDVYLVRAYNNYLSDAQVLDCYMVDQNSADELISLYNRNNVIDENGNVTTESVPKGMRYIIVTGRQDNGVTTVMQAAVNNNKKTKYNVDEILCVVKGRPELNFHLVGGCIRLQGTSSLAYPIKNYRIYLQNEAKEDGQLYVGCNEQGVGGTLQERALYSFRIKEKGHKKSVPVNCFCLKADFAESSSSHNTGMARLAQDVLLAAKELTPPQEHASQSYEYDIRTTVDGEPCYLFYRGSIDETPQFLGKFNFNNDKSTEGVFGFLDIPGYHDQQWVTDKFGGQNPTECWEFLNNDYPMGMFLDDDFDSIGEDGQQNWLKVFEARFPDNNKEYEADPMKKPTYLMQVVKWVKSTQNDGTKFKRELAKYFNVKYLCDYYMFTDIFGCVDQRVKNMMLAFWYDEKSYYEGDPMKGLRGYFIFYDNDTILGVRNDGRLRYNWDVDENTIDPELTTSEKTVYAYAGHNSILWKNLREQFPEELAKAYRRLRDKMSNSTIFNMFDEEQSAKFCERIYNLDAINKYVGPKTIGVEVNRDGVVSTIQYSYLESMQGSRKAHRHWWVTNRLGLFDARYSSGQYPSTDITFKGNSEAGATVRAIPARDFYFEFRREGDTMVHDEVKKNKLWSYTYNQIANIGTIFHLYGGLWMKELDLSGWGGFTDLTLPTLPVLEKLVLGTFDKTYSLTELVLGNKLPMMKSLTIQNYIKLPSIDVSGCNRLEELDASGCTRLSTISFAEGATLKKLHLPSNFQTLVLRSMKYLSWNGITFDGKQNLSGIWIENCSLIDGKRAFDELFAMHGSLKYVRITGLELEGDGSDLKTWYDAGLGGIDANGNTTNTRCKLCGNYRLTTYLDEAEFKKYVERFDELNIRQPQYTIIEFDDTVSDDANVSNLDNKTGYKYGNAYAPSGHIETILSRRHRVLAKITKKPTTKDIEIAGISTFMNNLDGQMIYYPLHDNDSNFYADNADLSLCTPAKLDGTEGDWMMLEPHKWFKGVNDYLNGKHYSCFSSNPDRPDTPVVKVLNLDNIQKNGGLKKGYKIMSGKADLNSSYSADSKYSVCKIDVSGYKRVRYPSVPGTNLVGNIFVNDNGEIIQTVVVGTLNCKFEAGMYLISDIPEGATHLYFSILQSAEFDKVVLSNSNRIEDMEPEWVEEDEYLCGVVGSSVMGEKLRSCISGGSTMGNLAWTDFHYYSVIRGMQQIDPMMHSWIANLFYAKYGRRDSQMQCGAGLNSSSRTTGCTSILGMHDTVNTDGNVVGGTEDEGLAFYETTDSEGKKTFKKINNINCIGYEDIYGNKYDMMDRVDLPNDSGNVGKWRIFMPDGSIRYVQGKTASDQFIAGVYHGLYMDLVPVGTAAGSSSTYYCDKYWVSSASSRVVYRGRYNAYANGGVSYASASYDASNTLSFVGSRLAFRGKVVKAQSVAAFKAALEVA